MMLVMVTSPIFSVRMLPTSAAGPYHIRCSRRRGKIALVNEQHARPL